MTVKQFAPVLGFLFIIIFATVFGPLPSADAQKVHALLIILGNDGDIRASVEKNESSMQTLLKQVSENCEVHMTIMKSERETIGKITRMTLSNARSANTTEEKQGIISAKQVVQWIQDLRSGREDTILIYYSGHGNIDTVGTHILNFDPEVTNDFVARNGLRDRLKQKRGRLKMLITDTCSNRVQTSPPIARVYAKVQSRERRYTKNLFLEHSGFLDITAASKGQYAWGNDEIGGYFTVSLIGSFTAEADKDEDGFLSWQEVFDVTRSKTQTFFSQTTFRSHNQRKIRTIGQKTQTPVSHQLPRKRTQLFPPSPEKRQEILRVFDEKRDGFFFGFGVESGITAWRFVSIYEEAHGISESDVSDSSGPSFTTNFKIGYGFSEQMLFYYTNRASLLGFYAYDLDEGTRYESDLYVDIISGLGGIYFPRRNSRFYLHGYLGLTTVKNLEDPNWEGLGIGPTVSGGMGYVLSSNLTFDITVDYRWFSDQEDFDTRWGKSYESFTEDVVNFSIALNFLFF